MSTTCSHAALQFCLCLFFCLYPLSIACGVKHWGSRFGLCSFLFSLALLVSLFLSHVHKHSSPYPSLCFSLSPSQRRVVPLYFCRECWQHVPSPWDAKLALPAVRSVHADWPRPHHPKCLCQPAWSCWVTSLSPYHTRAPSHSKQSRTVQKLR